MTPTPSSAGELEACEHVVSCVGHLCDHHFDSDPVVALAALREENERLLTLVQAVCDWVPFPRDTPLHKLIVQTVEARRALKLTSQSSAGEKA